MVLFFSVLIFVGPFLLHVVIDKDAWCQLPLLDATVDNMDGSADRDNHDLRNLASGDFAEGGGYLYPNPDYDTDPCRYARFAVLCFITLEECDICRRLLTAVILGGAIG